MICEREPHNIQDQYAVAVQKEVESSLDIYQGSYQACVQSFLRLRGTINYTVTEDTRGICLKEGLKCLAFCC